MDDQLSHMQTNSNTQKWYWLLSAAIIVWLLILLKPILMPFIVGALLAYLSNPGVVWLMRWKMKRTLAVTVVMVVILFILTIAIMIFIPLFQRQWLMLANALPHIIDWISQSALPWLNTHLNIDASGLDMNALKQALLDNWQQASGWLRDFLAHLSRSSMMLLLWIANLILIPVVMFYLLRDWTTILDRTQSVLPEAIRPTCHHLACQCDEVLSAFIRGQLWVMVTIGIVYTIGLWLVGLNLALFVGLIAGVFTVVPYLGFAVGLALAVILALVQFDSWMPIAGVLAVFAVGHVLENMVLTPLLVGDKIGLHPVVVIFAVLAGGQLFGFVGVLLALPIAAVIMVLIRYFYYHYLQDAPV